MFRRKKPTTPAAPADLAGREDDPRDDAIGQDDRTREPRVAAFPVREPRLEPVRSPDTLSSPARPQQESPASMSDKPSRPQAPAQAPARTPATPPPSGVPSPPARNPLSHLPHIGEPMRRPAYPGMPAGLSNDRPRPVVEGRKLIVGRDIVLTGSIAACDTLVVEGRVESDINDASVIEITSNGTFQGSADVDHAEIAGLFEGELTVHKKLSVARSGRIIGTVRYATIEIEAGGQIQGAMEVIGQNAPTPQAPDKPETGGE